MVLNIVMSDARSASKEVYVSRREEQRAELEQHAAEGKVHKSQVEISVTSFASFADCDRCGAREPMVPDRVEFSPYVEPPCWMVTGYGLPNGWSQLQVSDRENPSSPGGRVVFCSPCRSMADESLGARWKETADRGRSARAWAG